MFFKKKEPVDIRELPKKSSSGKAFIAKDGTGFLDLTKKRKLPSEIAKEKAILNSLSSKNSASNESETTSSFNFFDTPTQTQTTNNSNTENLIRKISSQISDLDTKLYKMEQRIELLERKVGISGSDSGSFAW